MSEFIEPGSDRSAPGVNEFLLLWQGLSVWQRAQFLDARRIDHHSKYPVSEMLAQASAVELLVRARLVFGPKTEVSAAKRHVILEWPPRGRLAEIWTEIHANASEEFGAESA